MREMKASLEGTGTLTFVTEVKPTRYNLHGPSSLSFTSLANVTYQLIKLRHQVLEKLIFTLEDRKLAQAAITKHHRLGSLPTDTCLFQIKVLANLVYVRALCRACRLLPYCLMLP